MVGSPYPPNSLPRSPEIRDSNHRLPPYHALIKVHDHLNLRFNPSWVFGCLATAWSAAPIHRTDRPKAKSGTHITFDVRSGDGSPRSFQSLLGFLMRYGGFTNCDTNVYYISIPMGLSDMSRLYTMDSAHIKVFSVLISAMFLEPANLSVITTDVMMNVCVTLRNNHETQIYILH